MFSDEHNYWTEYVYLDQFKITPEEAIERILNDKYTNQIDKILKYLENEWDYDWSQNNIIIERLEFIDSLKTKNLTDYLTRREQFMWASCKPYTKRKDENNA